MTSLGPLHSDEALIRSQWPVDPQGRTRIERRVPARCQQPIWLSSFQPEFQPMGLWPHLPLRTKCGRIFSGSAGDKNAEAAELSICGAAAEQSKSSTVSRDTHLQLLCCQAHKGANTILR